MDKMYSELKDIARNELKKLVKKGELSPTEVDAAKNAAVLIEKINKICEQEGYDEGYSQRRMGSYSYKDEPYRRWEIMSYKDGRSDYYPTSYGHDLLMDRPSDYSRHSIKDRAIDTLERLMANASSDYERQKIKEYIHKVESAE